MLLASPDLLISRGGKLALDELTMQYEVKGAHVGLEKSSDMSMCFVSPSLPAATLLSQGNAASNSRE